MSAVDEIVKVYSENVDDSEWVTEARAELAQLRATIAAQAEQLREAQRVSAVELAAYCFYLGESSDRLCELFEDMPIDERERYRKANAPQEEQSA